MSTGNPVLDVIDRNSARVDELAKRVGELSKAVAGANPGAVLQAVQNGAAAPAREVTRAADTALEAARMAADAGEALRQGRRAVIGWTGCTAFLAGLLIGAGGMWWLAMVPMDRLTASFDRLEAATAAWATATRGLVDRLPVPGSIPPAKQSPNNTAR